MNIHTISTTQQPKASTARLCDLLLGAQRLANAFDAIWTHSLVAEVGDPIFSAMRAEIDEAVELANRLHAEARK